jgi:predicted transcriptional regulator
MGKRGDNKPVFTIYDFRILNCLINNKELKIGEIEEKTNGTSAHIRDRINRLKEYGLLSEVSRGGRAIFISIIPEKKKFVKDLLEFFGGKIPLK